MLYTQVPLNAIALNSVIYRYIDGDFIFIDINKQVEKTEQVEKEDVIGKRLTEFFPKVKEFGLFDVLIRVFKTGKSEEHRLGYYEDERIEGWRNNWISRLPNRDVLVVYDDLSKEQHFERENLRNKWRFEEAEKMAHLGCWEWDMKSGEVVWSDEVYRIFGEEPKSFQPTLDKFLSYFDEKDKTAIQEAVLNTSQEKEFEFFHHKITRRDGTVRYLQCSGKKEYDDDQAVLMVGTVLDITAQYEIEDKLKALGSIVENSINEIYVFDAETLKFTYANKKAQDNIGYTLKEIQKMTPVDIKPDYTMSDFKTLMEPLVDGDEEYLVFQTVHRRKNESEYDVEIRLQYVDAGSKKQFVVMAHDISNRVRMESKLQRLATTDFLTGIYNRHKTSEELDIEIGRAKRYKSSFALLMFDIDFFKKINDSYGHGVGDYVLKELCCVVSAEIRESDRFGRWGGEEFLIILPSLNKEQAMEFSEKLRKSVAEYNFKDISQLTISIGATVFDDDTSGNILKRVDKALYKAKKEGRNKVEFK